MLLPSTVRELLARLSIWSGSRSLPGRVCAYRIACATTIFRRKVSTLIERYHDVPGQRDSGQVARGELERRGWSTYLDHGDLDQ